MTGLPPEATDLYGLTPGEFVAARNALVKQLKRDKRSDDAAVIGALRRPSPADHRGERRGARRSRCRRRVGRRGDRAGRRAARRDRGLGQPPARGRCRRCARPRPTWSIAAVAAVGDERRRPAVIDALRVAATRPGAALVGAGILGAGDPTDDLFAGMPEPAPAPAKRERPAASPKTHEAGGDRRPEPAEPAPAPAGGHTCRATSRCAAAARLVAAEDAARIADEELAARADRRGGGPPSAARGDRHAAPQPRRPPPRRAAELDVGARGGAVSLVVTRQAIIDSTRWIASIISSTISSTTRVAGLTSFIEPTIWPTK